MSLKINTVNNYQSVHNRNKFCSNSFKGNTLNVVKYALNPYKNINISRVKSMLRIDKTTLKNEALKGIVNPILNVNSPFQRHRAGFLYRLANRFCIENFDSFNRNAENLRNLVYDTYNVVKYPNKYHKNIVSNSGYSLQTLNTFFKDVANDKNKLKLASKLVSTSTSYGSNRISFDTLMAIINSNYAKTLLKKYPKHEKYILQMMKTTHPEDLSKVLDTYFTNLAIK